MLTPAELAAHMRVSERTVARMVLDGCPSMLVGRRRRFDLVDVTAWTKERATSCPPAKTPTAAGTPRLASAVAAYTDACRLVQVRTTPSFSKPS
jgi:excisionase family DNA binding protein